MHTWEDPEIQQIWTVNQANKNDWSKETGKKCLIEVIKTATRARFSGSLSESARVPIHMYSFLLKKKANEILPPISTHVKRAK